MLYIVIYEYKQKQAWVIVDIFPLKTWTFPNFEVLQVPSFQLCDELPASHHFPRWMTFGGALPNDHLLGFNGDLWWFNGDLWGFIGDIMGFTLWLFNIAMV